MNVRKDQIIVPLSIELNDKFTPKSCSFYISELIKYIVYNKEQIPYPFEHLKRFVLKRRERLKLSEETNKEQIFQTSNRVSFTMEKYYKKIEEAFEVLNTIFKCIEQKLLESNKCCVEEIVLLFGATPISPKDVYRIQIPSLSFGHSEGQHVWKKQLVDLYRIVIASNEVNANIRRNVGLTNMFVMIKVHKEGYVENEVLLPKDHYELSKRAQQVCFSFRSLSKKPCSYHDQLDALSITGISQLVLCDHVDNDSDDEFMWFQIAKSFKGFRDCKSNGQSVIDLWNKHSFIS